jgi:hypothetical protein
MPSTLARYAPLTGIAAVAIAVVAFIVGGESPAADDSTQEVIEFYAENDDANQWAAALLSLAAAFLVWFGGTLRATLRRGDDDAGRLAAIAFGGFLALAVGMTAFAGFTFAAADTVGDVPPEVTQTLSVLNSDFFFIAAMGNLVALVAAGIAIVRHGALPSGLGWVAVILGALSITPVGFFAILAGLVWIVIVSVVMYQAGTTATPGPTTTAGPAAPRV